MVDRKSAPNRADYQHIIGPLPGLKHYLEDPLDLSIDLGMPDALKEGPAADNIQREVEYL